MGNTNSDRKNARCYSLKFSRNTDSDIIEQLDKQESIQGYIKSLIRADMKKEEEKTMKTYTVKPEYIDLWAGDSTEYENIIVTEEQVREFAREWDKTEEELLEQLELIEE